MTTNPDQENCIHAVELEQLKEDSQNRIQLVIKEKSAEIKKPKTKNKTLYYIIRIF